MKSTSGLITIFFSLTPLVTFGQSVSDILKRYVSDIRVIPSTPIPASLLVEERALEVLQSSSAYYNDSSSAVRVKIYFLTERVGIGSKKADIRTAAVSQLMIANRDNDISNVGAVWDMLSRFRKDDFSISARDTIHSAFRRRVMPLDRLLKVIGYLEIVELKEEIRHFTLPPFNKKDRWAALLSLSRMGDQEATQSILKKSQKLEINDNVIYEVFPDLIYTRQPALISYVISALNSNGKNCFSADAENEIPVLCGYRIMEQLAPIIEQYPIQIDASGDLITKDYARALVEVRNWFDERGNNYKINTDRF